MKTISTFFIAPLIVGLAIAVFTLGGIGHTGYSASQQCVAIPVVLLVGLIVGALLNFAMFAPIYWFIGRLLSKKHQTEPGQVKSKE